MTEENLRASISLAINKLDEVRRDQGPDMALKLRTIASEIERIASIAQLRPTRRHPEEGTHG